MPDFDKYMEQHDFYLQHKPDRQDWDEKADYDEEDDIDD